MAFVFRSERKFDYDYHNDSFQDISINSKETLKLGNSDIIDTIMEQEKKILLNSINNIKNKSNRNPPFSSSSERVSLNSKDETPGPGAYNINKLYFNRHRQFSSRRSFSERNGKEYFNFPTIRLKGVSNDNPGPGQYEPNEKDLFGGKFKKLYKNRVNIIRNLSKSAKNIFIENIKDIKDNSINQKNDIKDFIFVSSSSITKRKNPNFKNNNSNNNNDKSFNSSSFINMKDNSILKNHESELFKKKFNKNNSSLCGATIDTQKSSLNTSNLTYTNQINGNSKILIPKLDNSEISKCFNSINNKSSLIDNNNNNINKNNKKDASLSKIDKDEEKNNLNQVAQFKYDKSKIFKNSQDHERIMSIKQKNFNLKEKINEFLLSQELFSQNPGPGYYNPIDPINQKYFFTKQISDRGVPQKRSKKKPDRISPGPGEYKIDNNSIENLLQEKMDKNKNINILFDVKKIAKSRIANEKQSRERNKQLKLLNLINSHQKLIFDNNNKEIAENQQIQYKKKKINTSLSFNFGSNSKRFKIAVDNLPGVGQYDINNYKSIEEKNSNIIENPSYDQLINKLENKSELLERSPVNKDMMTVPGVGDYNPDIITSIKYNFEFKNQIRNKPYNDKNSIKKKYENKVLKRVKEMKEKEKKLIELLGPGKYFNILKSTFNKEINMNKNKNKQIIRPPFGIGENKFENNKQNVSPGPGEYDIYNYYNWITKTYNVLFY